MDLGLQGCRAVVTGAAAGIGRAIVEVLSREGVSVRGRFTDVSDEDRRATWSLNLMAAVRLCRAAIPSLVKALASRHGLPREQAVAHHITAVRQLALGKAGTAEDVADAVAFLLSPRAGHITGTTLAVHGGMATHLM